MVHQPREVQGAEWMSVRLPQRAMCSSGEGFSYSQWAFNVYYLWYAPAKPKLSLPWYSSARNGSTHFLPAAIQRFLTLSGRFDFGTPHFWWKIAGMMWCKSILLLCLLFLLYCLAEESPYEDCPRGSFRERPFARECTLCPKGYYGEVRGLTSRECSAPCPIGRYSDTLGGKTIDDCQLVSMEMLCIAP